MSLPRRLQQLEAQLVALDGAKSEPMLLSEFDGFVAGLLVCPELVMPSEWLPIVLGRDEDGGAPFDDMAELQACLGLVMEHYNAVSRELQRGGGRYQPVFDVDPRHDEVLWEVWMGGFERAMALRPQSWLTIAPHESDDEAALALAGMLTLVDIADHGTELDAERIAALTESAPDLIPEWVEILNRWRLRNGDQRAAPVRSSKVGRNEPCPCGSGKKYKKCCGLN